MSERFTPLCRRVARPASSVKDSGREPGPNDSAGGWLPWALPGLIWAATAIGCCLSLYDCLTKPTPWSYLALGTAAYLTTWSWIDCGAKRAYRRQGTPPLGVSLRVGFAVALIAIALQQSGLWGGVVTNATSHQGPTDVSPLTLTNVIAAVLAAVLVVVSLIAQKSATDAREEAERARQEILDAMDVRMLALAGRLLFLAQLLRGEADDLRNEANEISGMEPELARYLSLNVFGLSRMARFLSLVYPWVLSPHSNPDIEGRVTILLLDLSAIGDNTPRSGKPSVMDRKLRLRLDYWAPVAHLLKEITDEGYRRAAYKPLSQRAEETLDALDRVRSALEQL